MTNINQYAKKYDMTTRDFECAYYSALNESRKFTGKSVDTDLFKKFMSDKLEEQGIEYRDIEKITDYYVYELEEYVSKKEQESLNKIKEGEAVDKVVEEMQTSNNTGIDSDIGMNRKKGYKVVPVDMYEGEDESIIDSDDEDEDLD